MVTMMAGKIVFLAGSTGGIGRQLAEMFSDHTVVRHGLTQGGGADCLRADVTDAQAVHNAIDSTVHRYGRIDVLINATGINQDGFAHKLDADSARDTLNVNVLGSVHLIRAALPSMRRANYGRIILIGSVVGQRPVLGTSVYGASKAALGAIARAVAVENAAKGITCNVIALGYFDAGMLHRIEEPARDTIRRAIPLQRFGRIEELRDTVSFLIATEYVTGQTINLNGGLFGT
jgi:3-oxoacyl-[acyl-carrier protein] reductase